MTEEKLKFQASCYLSFNTGEIEYGNSSYMSTLHFYHAYPDNSLTLLNKDYLFAVATYSLTRNEKYIYTYDYQKEQNWSTYRHDLNPESYSQGVYVFSDEVYFRITLKRVDNKAITKAEADSLSNILRYQTEIRKYANKAYFDKEIDKTCAEIMEVEDPDTLKLILLADSHYTVNGTWADTVYNINEICEKAKCHSIIHLGDITDGMVRGKITEDYIKGIQKDLEKTKIPIYYVLGNHDSNYFFSNPDRFTKEEMIKLYLGEGFAQSFYYVDFFEHDIRGIFLDSYDDNEEIRYGFADNTLDWLENILSKIDSAIDIIVVSHVPPIAEIHYWSDIIRNSDRLMKILEKFQNKSEGQILAYFHGHNHADQIYQKYSFPIISIGCSKCEYFTDYKPEDSFTYPRVPDTLSQELWDVALIQKKKKKINLIRFGAGENRLVIIDNKTHGIKIWAHRGCSYRFPENTLEAIKAAAQIKRITGIELDVQLSLDGEIVVIHDETINRTTTGTGWVKDYTLKELKQFKILFFSEKGDEIATKIPALSEVFDLLAPSCREKGLLLNIELKNNIILYPGLEEKLLSLVSKYGLDDYITYSSFADSSIELIKKLNPDAKVAILKNRLSECLNKLKQIEADALHPSLEGLDFSIPSDIKVIRCWNSSEPFYSMDRISFNLYDLSVAASKGITDFITNIPEDYLNI